MQCNYVILIGDLYFSIIDSLSIYASLNQRRRSITDAALKLIEKPKISGPFYQSFEKGKKFEDFVMKRFDKNEFSLVKMTTPVLPTNPGHVIEGNLDPDFIFRYIPSHEKFGVEAKFRSDFSS